MPAIDRGGVRPGRSVAGGVIPIAGRGTRALPLTRAVPKALLPLGDRTVVERVVDELRQAGVERLCLITGAGTESVPGLFADEGVTAVRQPEPRGLGDAMLCAEEFAGGRPVVVALGDCVYRSAGTVRALVEAFAADGEAVAALAVERVAPERLRQYGVVAVDGSRITALVEKPSPGTAPGDLAVTGRYVLGPRVFEALRATGPDAAGEVGIAEALASLVSRGERVVAVPVPQGDRRLDVGTVGSYIEAFVELALAEDSALRERICV